MPSRTMGKSQEESQSCVFDVTAVLSVTEVKDRLLIQILRMPTKRSVVRTLEDRQGKEIPGGESGLPPSEKRAAWA